MARSDRPNCDFNDDEDHRNVLRDVGSLDRHAALDLVAADIGHEIAHTLSFLRCLIADATEFASLSSDEVRFARKETERLQRVLGYLRKLKLPPPDCRPVRMRDVLQRSKAELVSLLMDRDVLLSVAVADGMMLRTDPHLIYILLRNMTSEMVRRVAKSTAVEVHAAILEGGHGAEIQVWGHASAAHPPLHDDSFDPWTTPPNGISGLELPVAQRISRILGWPLSIIRNGEREGLRIAIPASALLSENIL